MKKTIGMLIAMATMAGVSLNAQAQASTAGIPEEMNALMSKYTCIACHRPDVKLVGPAYKDVAKKKYTNDQIVDLIYNPVPTHWPGYPPMAAMKQVPKEDAMKLAVWINSLGGKAKKGGAKKGKRA